MISPEVAEFVASTGGTQQEAKVFLEKNNNDVGKAVLEFLNTVKSASIPSKKDDSKKNNTYYAGGSKSGVAVIAPGEADDSEIYYPPKQAVEAPPPPSFQGQARTLSSDPTAQPVPGPARVAKSDYTTPGAPKTRIRFQIPSGKVFALSVNLSSTIADLKLYVSDNCPEAQGVAISLTVPDKGLTLDDDGATVESLGLKMATIHVSF